jgi:DNA-binding beta-propeller fold protein YncE
LLFSGVAGTALNQLNTPYGIALNENTGTFYVSEYSGNRIMEYLAGASSGTIVAGGNGQGTGSTQLYGPFVIYLDLPTNSLFIANRGANNIVQWVLGASTWTLIVGDINGLSGSSSTLLNNPCGLTLDPLGNLYVADTSNHRIQFFPAGQTNGTTVVGVTGMSGSTALLLNTPYAVKVDRQNNLYVADTFNQRIQMFLSH